MNDETLLPSVLLHICCAPDATVAIERLKDGFNVTGVFYNPNIEPLEEYDLREAEAELVSSSNNIEYFEEPPDYSYWFEAVRLYPDEPERGERCRRCIAHRLERVANRAKELNIFAFTTTLTVSPHKDVDYIHKIGEMIANKYGLTYIPETFRKQDGYRRSVELSRQLGLYRQNYCGCRWSQQIENSQKSVGNK